MTLIFPNTPDLKYSSLLSDQMFLISIQWIWSLPSNLSEYTSSVQILTIPVMPSLNEAETYKTW